MIEQTVNNVHLSDEDVLNYMKQSTSVQDWNIRREEMKQHRDTNWIANYIDSSSLIISVLGKDVKNG